MTDRELLEKALAALCQSSDPKSGYRRNELFLQPKAHIELYQEAIEALRAALAQPEREWVGLTDEEIEDLWGEPVDCMFSGDYNAIRAIEAKLREKNT